MASRHESRSCLFCGDSVPVFGKIDVLVNNAGYGQNGLFELTPREQVQEQFDVNVFGQLVLFLIIPLSADSHPCL